MGCKLTKVIAGLFLIQETEAGAKAGSKSCKYSNNERVKLLTAAILVGHSPDYDQHLPIPFGTEGTIKHIWDCEAFLIQFVDRPDGVVKSPDHIAQLSEYSNKSRSIEQKLLHAGYPLHSRIRSLSTQMRWRPRALNAGEFGTVVGRGTRSQDLFVLFDGGSGRMPLVGSLQFDEVCKPETWEEESLKSPQGRYNVSLTSKGLMVGDSLYYLGQHGRGITLPAGPDSGKALPVAAAGVIVPAGSRNTDSIHVKFTKIASVVELSSADDYCLDKKVLQAVRYELEAQIKMAKTMESQLAEFATDKSNIAEMLEEQHAEQLKWKVMGETSQRAIDALSSENQFLRWLIGILASSQAIIAMIACMPKLRSRKQYWQSKKLAQELLRFYRPAWEQLLKNNDCTAPCSPHLCVDGGDQEATWVPAKKFLQVESHSTVPPSDSSSTNTSQESKDRTPLPIDVGLSKVTLQRVKGSADDEPVKELLMAAVTVASNRVLGNLANQPAFLPNIAIVPTSDVQLIEAAVNWVWMTDEFMEMDHVHKIAVKSMTEEGWEKGSTMKRP